MLRVEAGYGEQCQQRAEAGTDQQCIEVQAQVERVVAALDDSTTPVIGVLCFLDADWPLLGGSFTVDGVEVLWPRLLVKRISRGEVRGVDVAAVYARLAAALPPAV